jgi:GTPase-associated protein 1
MKRLEAAQVVYGNVEAARSARRQGGFQVLFRSSSHLTEDEVTREIEPRLFFHAGAGQHTKRVFSVISGDRTVLAQVIPVAGTDEHGRHGLYFGHALVFSKNDFGKIDNNPFLIFDSFPFFTSIEEATAGGGNERGDISPVSISLPRLTTHVEYDGISRDQLFELSN